MKESRKRGGSRQQDGEKYRNVLKERPYREESDRKKESRRSEQKSRSRGEEKRKSRKEEESYEELSRKKRKIESELEALDMEEAAEKKRAQERKTSGKSRKREVRIKEEPVSEDESKRRRKRNGDVPHSSKSPDDGNGAAWGDARTTADPARPPKEKPDFSVSGKLAEDTNMYNGVVIKYNEPQEARKPKRRWRLYPFKGDTEIPFIPVHRQSAYLFGRTRSIADVPIDHPSCSKQHAVLQFRLVPYRREDGSSGRRVRPYIIDLDSSNGTFLNNKKVEPRRYVELQEKDVLKFGFSTREYVVLHEESRDDPDDDDVQDSN